MQIQLNGEIFVGAGGSGTSGHFILARFNPNGTLDASFGTSGIKIGAAEGGGLSMMTAADGEAVIIGKAPSGSSGIILQEFNTLATSQTYYVEYDADYNATSLSNSSGGVVERYAYDPYGNVTVESATGATLGNGSAAGSLYGWVYLHQGLRLDVLTDLNDDRRRQTYDPTVGRFLQEDPAGYIDTMNVYQSERSNTISSVDPNGLDPHSGADTSGERPGIHNCTKYPVIVARDQGQGKPLMYRVLGPGETAGDDLDWDQVYYLGSWYRARPGGGALMGDAASAAGNDHPLTGQSDPRDQTIYDFTGCEQSDLLSYFGFRKQFFISNKATWYPGSKGETIPSEVVSVYYDTWVETLGDSSKSIGLLDTTIDQLGKLTPIH